MVRQKGSITIYLSLSLILVLMLICTLIESGRVNCINAKLKGISYMAADSCFSEYAREVFDEYGVMMLWMSDAEFTGELNSYISSNLTLSDLDIYTDAGIYQMQHDGSAILKKTKITDDKGRHFEKQVVDYMQYFVVSEIMQKILSEIGMFKEGSKLSAFVEKINEYKDVFLSVGNTVAKIQEYADRAQSIAYNPKTILGNMGKYLSKFNKSGNVLYSGLFNVEYWKLRQGKDELESCMEGILSEVESYYGYSEEAKKAIDILSEELSENSGDYSEQTLESLKGELEQLSVRSGNGGSDYYNISSNENEAKAMLGKLENLGGYISSLEGIEHYSEISNYTALTETYIEYFSDFNVGSLGVANYNTRVKRISSGFLSTIGSVFTRGLLAAVTDGNISGSSISRDNLPSKAAGVTSSLLSGITDIEVSVNKILMGEYILTHFGNYLEPKKDTALKYETEYILGGYPSDKENLKKVIKEIVSLRAGLNLISLMQDPEKMDAAKTLAAGIIGFTGNEALIEAVKMVIVSCWCIAEGLCDVKALLKGRKISIIKSSEDWTISVKGLKNFSRNIVPSASDDKGIGYEEYLRILLLMQGNSTQDYRTMDLIQANMCKKYNSDFRVNECISAVELKVQFEAAPLFTSFPFVVNMVGSKGKYDFQYIQAYSYE